MLSVNPNAFATNGIYQWNDNSNQSGLIVNQSGTYSVMVQSGICSIRDSIEIEVLEAPPVDLGRDTFLCDNQLMVIDAHQDLATAYTWQDGSTSSDFEIDAAGIYTVAVEYLSGCINNDSNLICRIKNVKCFYLICQCIPEQIPHSLLCAQHLPNHLNTFQLIKISLYFPDQS